MAGAIIAIMGRGRLGRAAGLSTNGPSRPTLKLKLTGKLKQQLLLPASQQPAAPSPSRLVLF